MPSALRPRFPSGRGFHVDQRRIMRKARSAPMCRPAPRAFGPVRSQGGRAGGREPGPQTLGEPLATPCRSFSPQCGFCAIFQGIGQDDRTNLAGNDRTFDCRRRHMGVGDFSAQHLNGRRQAMIFRLRGVALFNDQFAAYQPSGNGRYGQTRWLSLAGLGGSEANVLTRGVAGVERSARRRHAHCKFIVVAPGRSILLKNSRRFKIANACRKRRAHSQIVHAV